jgi:hypothetical protein
MKQFISVILLLAVLSTARATRIEYGKNAVINTPVYEDLYIAGADVIVNAPVYGDLVVAGGTVTINDTVTNDILVAGGTIIFNGYVGDDIRCAAGRLKILQNVAGDVVVTGGTIDILKNVTVGNLVMSGGECTISGNVDGLVRSASGTLVLNGLFKNGIDCRGGTIKINGTVHGPAVLAAQDEIIIGDQAVFSGGVRYWTPGKKVDFRQSIRLGQATYDSSLVIRHDRWYYLGYASVIGLVWYIGTVFFMIMCVQYLFGATMKKTADTAYNNVLRSLGKGLLLLIGMPVAAAIAMVTIIGLPIGVILLLSYILLLFLATVITSVVTAHWLNNRSAGHWNYWRLVFMSLAIFFVLKIVSFTPFFGWLLMIVMASISYGALLKNINWRKQPAMPY